MELPQRSVHPESRQDATCPVAFEREFKVQWQDTNRSWRKKKHK